MKILRQVQYLILLLVPLLCSCSQKPKEELIIEPLASTQETQVVSREAVFTYGETAQSKNIILTLSSEPVLLKEQYVKLVGIVAGNNPLACLEISGKGIVVGIGEKIESYVIKTINYKEVVLCLKN